MLEQRHCWSFSAIWLFRRCQRLLRSRSPVAFAHPHTVSLTASLIYTLQVVQAMRQGREVRHLCSRIRSLNKLGADRLAE